MNFPVFSQLAGKLEFRDGFARDCLLQRRVMRTIGSAAAVPGQRLTSKIPYATEQGINSTVSGI